MCLLGGVGWLGEGPIMIIKVSVIIIDGVLWEQNMLGAGRLVWLGGNKLGSPLGIWFCGRQ